MSTVSEKTWQGLRGLELLATSPAVSGWRCAFKRGIDIVIAFFVLVLLAIPTALIALAIRLNSPGPVLFRQLRVGRHGKPFTMYKFRSMRIDADGQVEELADLNEVDGPIFKIRRDPRVTPLGRFLRRTSLDELPQLFNVLAGDMSLVGPRPPLPDEVEEYEMWQLRRLEVKPGITGLWQVNGRSELSFWDMIALDIHYIENLSLRTDMIILLKTLPAVLSCRGAY